MGGSTIFSIAPCVFCFTHAFIFSALAGSLKSSEAASALKNCCARCTKSGFNSISLRTHNELAMSNFTFGSALRSKACKLA